MQNFFQFFSQFHDAPFDLVNFLVLVGVDQFSEADQHLLHCLVSSVAQGSVVSEKFECSVAEVRHVVYVVPPGGRKLICIVVLELINNLVNFK